MFQHLNKILLQFRTCFNRQKAWENFVVLVIGFMLRTNNKGISSMVSSLRLKDKQYPTLLHFFRSNSYTVSNLYEEWISIARREAELKRITGRVILLGDHIKISKEGRHMPDIQILHQDSENSGKGEYIEGHTYAQVSALITNDGISRSLPLITQQQKSPPKKEGTNKPDGDTLVTQMVNLTVKATELLGDDEKAIVALDAYFSKATAFLAAEKALDKNGKRRLEIVTRGRDDSVGFTPPQPRVKGQRGATSKYGKKIVLWSLFSDLSQFTKTNLCLYGKMTTVRYQCLDLIWQPLKQMIRFIIVDSERGRMILMSSDLTLTPEDIITIYCLRFKIEAGFDEQKNDMGCFSYHFWTTALPKRKRWVKNNQPPLVDKPILVDNAKHAIDAFVCLGTIASGISTIIAFSHNHQIWNRYPGWLRTRRNRIPSLSIVKETLAQDFPAFLCRFSHLPICKIINSRLRSCDFFYSDVA
jgi:hypothetical protein